MAVVQVLACDICRKQPADTWQIAQAGQPEFLVDLCHEHAASLRELRKAGRKPHQMAPGSRRTGLRKSVVYPAPATSS